MSTQRAIHVSSISREESGISRPDDFTMRFTPSLVLSGDMDHELALGQVNMTYSWHNVSPEYDNDTIKYSYDNGTSWSVIKFSPGMYSYDDLENLIHENLKENGHVTKVGEVEKYDIQLTFVLTTYKVIIELTNDYQLDITNSQFGKLIGFNAKVITATEYGTMLPNITNDVDVIHINTNLISDSIVDGVASNTLAVIPTNDLRRSYPFTINPVISYLFNPSSSNTISRARFYLTDSLKRPVSLNGIDWHMTLILRSTPK